MMAELGLWLVVVSVVSLIAALVLVPLLVTRIPVDYFSRRREHRPLVATRHPIRRLMLMAAKNLLGAGLVLAGLLMLLTPGQGLLTLLAGLMLMEFPGKYAIERWLIGRPPILRVINRLRARRGYPPLRPVRDESSI